MAWAERLPSGKWRGCWRDPSGNQHHTRRPEFPEHPYAKKREALDAAQEAEVKANRRASIEVGAASASIPWGDYWDSSRKRRGDTDTADTEDHIAETYLRPKWGEVPLNRIKQRDVKAWALDLQIGREASYAARIYGVFRASINAAMEQDPPLLDASPCANVRIPKPSRVPKQTKAGADIDPIRPYLKQCYQDMWDFGYETGLRPGEMSGMHAPQADRKSGWLNVDKVFVGGRRLIRHSPKDDDSRDVPLTLKAISILDRLLQGRDLNIGCGLTHVRRGRPVKIPCRSLLVFVNEQGDPITAQAYWRALNRAAEAAGVAPVKPYDSRHWFITRALEGGLDIVVVAEIVGHADVKQTQDYVYRTEGTRDRLRAALGETTKLELVQGQPGATWGRSGADLDRTPSERTGKEEGGNTG